MYNNKKITLKEAKENRVTNKEIKTRMRKGQW